MQRAYVHDTLKGSGSGTRAFVERFFEAFASPTAEASSIWDTVYGAMPPPLDVLYPVKQKNPIRRYIGRAAPAFNGHNSRETLWCIIADVSKARQRLTTDQQMAIHLKYTCDLGDHEIANLLGVPVNTVLDRISESIDVITAALDGVPC